MPERRAEGEAAETEDMVEEGRSLGRGEWLIGATREVLEGRFKEDEEREAGLLGGKCC